MISIRGMIGKVRHLIRVEPAEHVAPSSMISIRGMIGKVRRNCPGFVVFGVRCAN